MSAQHPAGALVADEISKAVWVGLLSRSNAVAFTVARSDERTAFYVRAGFSF
jgi:hypothetical protein